MKQKHSINCTTIFSFKNILIIFFISLVVGSSVYASQSSPYEKNQIIVRLNNDMSRADLERQLSRMGNQYLFTKTCR